MDTRQLRYFIAIAELGSFSAAARHLGVAQPALSRHVRLLEEQLEAPLLTRSARGIRLTDAGERLFHHAQGILSQMEMIPLVVQGARRVVTGSVSIGLPTSVGSVLAKPLLVAALQRYPAVRLKLVESLSGFLHEWVEQGRLDISVLYDARPSGSVRLDPLLVEDLYLVGAAGSFSAASEEVPFMALTDYRLMLPSTPHSHRQLLDAMALSHGIRLTVLVDVDSLSALKALAASGLGHIVLPFGAVAEEVALGRLEARRIVEPAVSRSVSVATSGMRGTTRACEEMRRLILEVAGGLIEAGPWRGRRTGGEEAGTGTPVRPE